jgi:hypothetical protein
MEVQLELQRSGVVRKCGAVKARATMPAIYTDTQWLMTDLFWPIPVGMLQEVGVHFQTIKLEINSASVKQSS